ncbi:MAG: TolC family protein [Candidatus Anammoximicrobium sp.]|nr:TolC family protein [Candidatus Anammoximicrobium sp.]
MLADSSVRISCWTACVIALGGLLAAGGCSRQHYRVQADREVHELVTEKSNDPRWAICDFSIDMDPRSRYFDAADPDRPPMPPDDPASHQFMRCVDSKKGWPHWHANGERVELENPHWRAELAQYAPMNEKGEVVLDVDTALRVAYIHSPDYQNQLETLYLSALDVSTERFRLDTQFFGGNTTRYAHSGGLNPPRLSRGVGVLPAVQGADSSTLTTTTEFELRRRFATAGELLVGFANSFVWEFSGGDANLTSSLANFSLVQPLLRGAGRHIALEQLTIVERVLLGNLRAFERYRQGFYTRVAIGELGVSGPSRRGGFLGGTGLTGFSGTGSGGLGGVGVATGFGRTGIGASGGGTGGGAGYAGGGAGTVGGFLGLLQQLQQIRNTQDSLNLQLRTLALLEAYLDAGVIDLVQVDQFRQNIETERATLLQAQNSLLLAQDNYVTGTLGLPPDLGIAMDDQLIRQFQLVDPQTTAMQNRIADFQEELGELPDEPDQDALQDLLKRLVALRPQFDERFVQVEQDLARTENTAQQREHAMTAPERSLYQKDRRLLADSLAEIRQRFEAAVPKLGQLQTGLDTATRRQTAAGLVVWLDDQYRLAGELTLIQARARLEAILVESVEMDAETAFQTALANRLDIMNSRAALVDTWRLIAYNANALQSRVDVVLDGDISTSRNNPLSFHSKTATVRAGLEFDAPFTRLLERNNYRQALIDYQQDRRQFIQSLDSVHRDMRQLLRRLNELRVNLEIQRRAVAISIRRVDLTQEQLNKPVPPAEPGQAATQFGPTAALDLLTALSDLRNTQNNFMSVWLNYYATRMQLMRELGLMQLDEQGRWIDTPLTRSDQPATEAIATPPAVPVEWMQLANQEEPPGPWAAPAVYVDPSGMNPNPSAPHQAEPSGQGAAPAAYMAASPRAPNPSAPHPDAPFGRWAAPAAYLDPSEMNPNPSARQAVGPAAAWLPPAGSRQQGAPANR